ncbi:GtrA family protein [Pseudodesulfovibrio sp. zrk46]|uniref:GtrA family protein n=1 Tax=Pseudodesulfovibrio sp. zrk46 TaxID=2725288 RepID=UPI0014497547|nr:GtrA family protein [Pseudodesulfovibrio sp. zrk46]QJB58047.1 hypothetical protein HFN16_17390 [Pseudodesulfovibrio sp. zrk46]
MRFLSSGAANTIACLLLYELLLFFFSPTISYFIAWLCGVVFMCIVLPLFVYKNEKVEWKKSLYNFIYYVVYLFVSLKLILYFISLNVYEELAPFLALCITVPMSFIFTRLIYNRK